MAKKEIPEKLKRTPVKAKEIPEENSAEEAEFTAGTETESPEEKIPAKISSENSSKEKAEEKGPGVEEDYLRQYQYKMVNNVPVLGAVGGKLTDPDPMSKAATMKSALLKQRRISTLIPLDPGTDPKVPVSVCLNGYRLDFPVNTYIEIPEQISQVIMKSHNQTIAALSQFQVSEKAKNEAGY